MFRWHELFKAAPTVLTIVGMAKNVGKTVTLNYLQKMLQQEGWTFALTSIGRDGEAWDALTNLAKPSIVVPPGTILATADKVIEDAAAWEYLQYTKFITPLGKVVILKAKSTNKVMLAGPGKNRQMQELLRQLAAWNPKCILIDGAFDRQSSADPLVSNQVLLACGATVSQDLAELIYLTKSRVEQLTLPGCNQFYRELAGKSGAKVLIVDSRGPREIALNTSLLPAAAWSDLLCPDCVAIIVKGAVGDGLAEALLEQRRPLTVIVQDGGKIFITATKWRRLTAGHIQFQVVNPICLLGVTINPTYPGGKGFDP